MNFSCLVIMEKEEFKPNLQNKLKEIVNNYCSDKKVDPYIKFTKEELILKYQCYYHREYEEQLSFNDYIVNYCGFKLDEDGNALSTFNPNSKMDNYTLGGTFRGILVDKFGESPCIAPANEIDWDKTIEDSYRRALRDWKRIEKKQISSQIDLFDLKEDDCRNTYVYRQTYTFIDAIIDKNGVYHSIEDCNNVDEWHKYVYNPFIKDLGKDDVIVLIDCEN